MNELKTKIKNHTFIIKIKLSIPQGGGGGGGIHCDMYNGGELGIVARILFTYK